jgi:hypothetical protein
VNNRSLPRTIMWSAGAAAGVVAAVYAGYGALTWFRYGKPPEAAPEDHDSLLDEFMPQYDVVERHHTAIDAPAAVVMAAATEMDIAGSPIAKAIFKAREIVMRAGPRKRRIPRGVVEETLAMGWGVLADRSGAEIVIGAVTKPWEGDVKFIAIPAQHFAAFTEPGFVKIAWTLRADPITATRSIFRTETRAVATDDVARSKFRRYWALVSPGIRLIRRLSLRPLRNDAERRARTGHVLQAAV